MKVQPNDNFKQSTSGFVTALYAAYVRADSANARSIEAAFPRFFESAPDTELDAYLTDFTDLLRQAKAGGVMLSVSWDEVQSIGGPTDFFFSPTAERFK